MKDFTHVKEMERIHGLHWEQLVEIEPRLDQLLESARSVFCRNWEDVHRGFSQFKTDIHHLTRSIVNRYPSLEGHAVYDVMYWKLHNAVAKDRRDKP